jgi:hypothetical protein
MIPPDEEIYEVEKRIAERRQRVERAFRETGRQTLRSLTAPWALAGAALLGFLVAGGVRRQHRDAHVDPSTRKAAKASTLSSVAMAVATWVIKSQFGSPVEMARFFMGRLKSRKKAPLAAPAPSGVPDRLRPRRREATTAR